MPLQSVLSAFSQTLQSDTFLQIARTPDAPHAFTRQRKLPLVTLVATLITGLRQRLQTELDQFLSFLQASTIQSRQITEQAFAKARKNLSTQALPWLNDQLILHSEAAGLVPRWHGLRLVAADGSQFLPALRACHQSRLPQAATHQQIMGLYLPGAELMLAASLYSTCEGERQILFEHLDRLGPSDLLLLDRGYMATWLAAVLIHKKIPFCMRVDKTASGWACVRNFRASGLRESIVTLPPVPHQDALDYECPTHPVHVRLVRHTVPGGKTRIIMTNLMDSSTFPAHLFGDLYHQRWRIEEAFKRLKHRLNLEHVSGLSQQSVMQDLAAKILCDNLQSLMCATAAQTEELTTNQRINRTSAHSKLRHLIPAVLLAVQSYSVLHSLMADLAKNTHQHKPGRSNPRKKSHTKPHKNMAYKSC